MTIDCFSLSLYIYKIYESDQHYSQKNVTLSLILSPHLQIYESRRKMWDYIASPSFHLYLFLSE